MLAADLLFSQLRAIYAVVERTERGVIVLDTPEARQILERSGLHTRPFIDDKARAWIEVLGDI